ncbi:hypothetical protein [Desulforhabdus amnigena]|jgi:hypothetical protein|uniref:Uncharacterized protein n=1 Tax=Desulforhabdus amnigena TaxID=40218 RepID=A0A9W6CZG6_9BACT|nr:hypothetical protein [Desulforhabdus amnigena]GLI33000.1 hypothetical protein DAMNIGENAA_04330 [Desulforhabdus amnigena]
MASKTQKTESIRAKKHRSNKVNLKTLQKLIQKNIEVLQKTAEAK